MPISGRAAYGFAWLLGGVAVLSGSALMRAADIELGDYKLLPNQANQTVDVYVSGGDLVRGVDIEAFVADGGPDANGKILAPKISSINLFAAGSVFAENNVGYLQNSATSGYNPNATESQFFESATMAANGSVALGEPNSPQLLAVLTVDTRGFKTGKFSLVLDNPSSPTNFPTTGGIGPTLPDVQDGWIDLESASPVTSVASSSGSAGEPTTGGAVDPTPEPAALAALAASVPLLLHRPRFKRRRSRRVHS